MNIFSACYLVIFFVSLFCGFNIKAASYTYNSEYSLNHSDNVDSSHSRPIADYFSDLVGFIQKKDDQERIRLKLKFEKFHDIIANDNIYLNLNYQFTPNKKWQYLFELYNQSYRGNPITQIDNTSDNKGLKFSLTLNKELTDRYSMYYTFSGQFKNYQKQYRNDSMLDFATGFYSELLSNLSFGPEINIEYDYSTDPMNTNYNLTPGFYSNLILSDKWDWSLSSYYTRIQYVKKIVSDINITKENQAYWGSAFVSNYKLTKKINVALKYMYNHNFSNNPQSVYSTQVLSFNMGLIY